MIKMDREKQNKMIMFHPHFKDKSVHRKTISYKWDSENKKRTYTSVNDIGL
jgi:hypothetical protein